MGYNSTVYSAFAVERVNSARFIYVPVWDSVDSRLNYKQKRNLINQQINFLSVRVCGASKIRFMHLFVILVFLLQD